MMLKEKLYPWPWLDIVTQNIVPESKLSMELIEIRYSQLISTTYFYLSSNIYFLSAFTLFKMSRSSPCLVVIVPAKYIVLN